MLQHFLKMYLLQKNTEKPKKNCISYVLICISYFQMYFIFAFLKNILIYIYIYIFLNKYCLMQYKTFDIF